MIALQRIALLGALGIVALPRAAGALGGNVSGTLPTGVYVATTTLTVPAGQTWTLEPGVILKMETAFSINVLGTLISEGTAANPIYLTSIPDDSIGGDTDGAGPTQGAPGNWGALSFSYSTGSRMSFTTVRFGSQIALTASSPQFNQVTISSMSISAMSADPASQPAGTGNTAFACPFNGINVSAGLIAAPVTWQDIGFPYLMQNGRIQINVGGRLTLPPGVIIKGGRYGVLAVVDGGELVSVGTPSRPVIWTVLADDTAGGDTNNNGSGTPPGFGEWGGIQFIRAGTGSRLEYTQFRHGGGTGDLAVFDFDLNTVTGYVPSVDVMGSTLTLNNVEISSSYIQGIQVHHGSSVTLNNSMVAHTGRYNGILVQDDSQVSIFDTRFIGNNGDGPALYALDNSQVRVRDCEFRGNRVGISAGTTGLLDVQGSTFALNGFAFGPAGAAARFTLATPFLWIGNRVFGNVLNSVDIQGGALAQPVVWSPLGDIPYTFTTGRIQINAGGRLTLQPGVVIKSNEVGVVAVVDGGELVAAGSAANPVVWTALADDSIAGDTKSDGSTTSPSSGNWGGVQFIRAGTGSRLEHTQFRHGGGTSNVPVYDFDLNTITGYVPSVDLMGSTLTLNNVQVSSSYIQGVQIHYGSSITLNYSAILGTTLNNGLLVQDNSRVDIFGSRFNSQATGLSVVGRASAHIRDSEF